MFRGVTVWLDDLAPGGGSFGQALMWAERLHLPLRGIALEASPLPDGCAERCHQRGIAWSVETWGGGCPPAGIERTGDLFVFSHALPGQLWDRLLHWTLDNPEAMSLVCPAESAPLGRPLVVNEEGESSSAFLLCAARLCKTLGVAPVVLTVAHYEGDAIRRERDAESAFRHYGVEAEFDSMACADTCRAVHLVARCRGCAPVFVERRQSAPWWRWLRRDTLRGLLGLSMPLTFLTFSGKRQQLEPDTLSPEPVGRRQEHFFPHSAS